MNKQRRAKLKRALVLLDKAFCLVEEAMDEEQEALDNLPDGIKEGERGQEMEHFCYVLEEIKDAIDEQKDTLMDEFEIDFE